VRQTEAEFDGENFALEIIGVEIKKRWNLPDELKKGMRLGFSIWVFELLNLQKELVPCSEEQSFQHVGFCFFFYWWAKFFFFVI